MYLILGWVIFAVGVWSLTYVFRIRREARQSASWPQTTGRILTASLRQTGGRYRPVYAPEFEYEYSVNGRAYRGRRWNFGVLATDKSSAQAVVDRYLPGKTVPVYYNPAKPSASVLERDIGGSWVGMVVGIVFAIVGLGLIVYWS